MSDPADRSKPDETEHGRLRGQEPVGPPNFPRRSDRPLTPDAPEASATEPRLLLRREGETEPQPPFGRRQKGLEATEPGSPTRLSGLLDARNRRAITPSSPSEPSPPALPAAPAPLSDPAPSVPGASRRRAAPPAYPPPPPSFLEAFQAAETRLAEAREAAAAPAATSAPQDQAADWLLSIFSQPPTEYPGSLNPTEHPDPIEEPPTASAPAALHPIEPEPQNEPVPDTFDLMEAATRRLNPQPRRDWTWSDNPLPPEPVPEPPPPETFDPTEAETRRLDPQPRRDWAWADEPPSGPSPRSPEPPAFHAQEVEAFLNVTRRLESKPRRRWQWMPEDEASTPPGAPLLSPPASAATLDLESMRTPEPDSTAPRRLILNQDAQEQEAAAKPSLAPPPEEPAEDATLPPTKNHTLRRLLLALAALLLLALLAAAIWVATLRHAMHASLPQLDGTVTVAGLHAPVRVERNAQGVPTLAAASLDDLVFAQAYVTASDRLWQMDALRRHAAGDLAAILGPSQLDHDRLQRTLGLRYTADRIVPLLPPAERHQLEVYAAGVNAFLQSHRDRLPVEFHLLAYTPDPWQPRDSILIALALVQDLSSEFPIKLAREHLSQHLPPDLLADLYPTGNWRDHPPGEALPDLTSPKQVEEIPLDPTQAQLSPKVSGDPVALAELVHRLRPCDGCLAGSNGWAVAGSHTASGKPLLSNDMHLNLSVPDIWYEARLEAPLEGPEPLRIEGFTLPGLPFVFVGRNQHLSWGITNLTGDVQDLRIEHLRTTSGHTEFERPDGSWQPVLTRHERIRVRGGLDRTLDVNTVLHPVGRGSAGETTLGSPELEAPILTPLLKGETRSLSLSWTALDPSLLHVPFLDADRARSGAELVAAMSSLGSPPLNLVYADDTGLIGYHALGRIPVRGPAVHHPREREPLYLPAPEPGTEPSAEPSSEPGENQPIGEDQPADEPRTARLEPTPRFQLASWNPPQHRRLHRAPPPPVRAIRAIPKPRHIPTEALAAKPTPEADVPPPAPQLDYTIGSPIPPVPVDALDANADWSGYVPFDDLPAVQNPPTGFVATANSRVTTSDYPYQLATDWVSPFRTERLVHRLAHARDLTPHDMLQLELDVQSDADQGIAERFAYALDHASPKSFDKDGPRLHEAADLLRRFTGQVRTDSAAAAVERVARNRLLPTLLTAKIHEQDGSRGSVAGARSLAQLYRWNESGSAVEQILTYQPARWLPHGFANWNDFLAAEVEEALREAHAPARLSTWRYGEIHRVSIDHPVLAMLPTLAHLIGAPVGSGPRSLDGYRETVRASEDHFGSSERFTADLSGAFEDATGAFANITTGESGDPVSPYYFDQMEAWFAGTTFPFVTPTRHTLTLQP